MAKFVNQTQMAEAKAIDSAKTARTGIFYDSQKWSDYLKQSMVLNATTMRTGGDGLINRQPIFYHPEMWNNYKNQTALSKVANVKTNASVMSDRQPLLYHPEEWDRAFDPAMVHIGRKSAIGTVINRQNQVKKIERKVPSNSLSSCNQTGDNNQTNRDITVDGLETITSSNNCKEQPVNKNIDCRQRHTNPDEFPEGECFSRFLFRILDNNNITGGAQN